jgi:hypothetical protein
MAEKRIADRGKQEGCLYASILRVIKLGVQIDTLERSCVCGCTSIMPSVQDAMPAGWLAH